MMRYSPAEKMEIIQLVEHSNRSIRQTLAELDLPRSTFYDWYSKYQEEGFDGLADKKPGPHRRSCAWIDALPGIASFAVHPVYL
jgi:transposase-like protein